MWQLAAYKQILQAANKLRVSGGSVWAVNITGANCVGVGCLHEVSSTVVGDKGSPLEDDCLPPFLVSLCAKCGVVDLSFSSVCACSVHSQRDALIG